MGRPSKFQDFFVERLVRKNGRVELPDSYLERPSSISEEAMRLKGRAEGKSPGGQKESKYGDGTFKVATALVDSRTLRVMTEADAREEGFLEKPPKLELPDYPLTPADMEDVADSLYEIRGCLTTISYYKDKIFRLLIPLEQRPIFWREAHGGKVWVVFWEGGIEIWEYSKGKEALDTPLGQILLKQQEG